jgi:opacity protein-like surface antigen
MKVPSIVVPCAVLVLTATAATGQRVPATESTALGGDVGIFIPKDDRLDRGLEFGVTYEYYLSPRVGLRVGFASTDPEFKREPDDSLRQRRLDLGVIYNWEGGKVHPFVGAGFGAYFLQPKDNGESFGDGQTKAGVSLGGGLEYFTGRTVSVKGEARYHIVKDTDLPFVADASGLSLTVGLKVYF